MNLSVRDVKRLLTAGIKAEYERTHDPRLEDADAMCAASCSTNGLTNKWLDKQMEVDDELA